MKENGKFKVIYSWPIIILMLFLLFPLGIFLLIRRLSIAKKVPWTVGTVLNIIGILSYVIGVSVIIADVSFSATWEDIQMIAFFILLGLALHTSGQMIKAEIKSAKQYMDIIVNDNVRSIDHIAEITGKPYDTVRNDIRMMIRKQYLQNAYIDENADEVVLPNNKTVTFQEAGNLYNETNKEAEIRTVSCSSCGATNTIRGEFGECEYCGSAIR